jgi:hypothetical protein
MLTRVILIKEIIGKEWLLRTRVPSVTRFRVQDIRHFKLEIWVLVTSIKSTQTLSAQKNFLGEVYSSQTTGFLMYSQQQLMNKIVG